eukprot:TRINITY_DN10666_c0_g1_i1.p1 TRINITY_DN10666_c0_g1~~TRINITY_DN10666_c0_g1_i1.p1  ORF type:complete len:216 (-),score=45.34 TRINITY_DN10666_c0_g1_i1:218-865(-)
MSTTLATVREATGTQRPLATHGCKPVEVVPNVWTAHFHDMENVEQLKAISADITTVVNCATDKCPTKTGDYGDGVTVMRIEGLLDDPDILKKVDAMVDGPEKDAARAELPAFSPEESAGNAKKDFEEVCQAIDEAKAAGGAAMVHCHASLSRSAAFIIAYIMKTQQISLVEAIKQMKEKWDATWPNDTFMGQLIEYERELGLGGGKPTETPVAAA